MKRIISMLTAAACILSAAASALPVCAMEAGTWSEHSEQWKAEQENAFPDPEAKHTQAAVGDLEFYVYDEYAALTKCTNPEITEVTIPAYVEDKPVLGTAESYPFGFCRQLREITLPETMQFINWNELVSTTVVNANNRPAEQPVPSVSAVHIPEENPYFTVSDGIVYSKDMKTLVGCPPAMELKELAVPEKTEVIGDYAFAENLTLEKAVIPDQIKHICNGAFAACPKLRYVEYPTDVTMIAGLMFFGCASLTDLRFRGKLETIGYQSLVKCTALTDFTIPETVTAIGTDAFEEAGCTEHIGGISYVQNWAVGSDEDITAAVLREGTVGVAEMTFFNRSDITLLYFPDSVKYIGDACYLSIGRGLPSVLHYRGSIIGATTFTGAKKTTDIYIYDPECEIADNEKAIPAAYKYAEEPETTDIFEELVYTEGAVTIHGYAGSTAEAYAKKYNRQFAEIPAEATPGDVDGDGKAGITDAVMLTKWLSGTSDAFFVCPHSADLNADQQINAVDLTLLKRQLLTAAQA